MPRKRTASKPRRRSARGNRAAAAIGPAQERDLVERLARLAASVVYDALRSLGEDNPTLPARIRRLTGAGTLAGRIFTVAGREKRGLERDQTLHAWAKLLSSIPPGRVVVCQPRSHAIALMGELSARALAIKGVKGYVVDGACRDLMLVEEAGLPVFGTHATPADIAGRWLPDDKAGKIRIDGTVIHDGDFLIADADGVVVIPAGLATAAIDEAEAMTQSESAMRKAIRAGEDPFQAYLRHRKF